MIKGMYTVYDRKVGAHLPIFFARSDDEAVRMLKETMLQGDSPFVKWPEDYHLYRLGEFEDTTGEIITDDKPVPLQSAFEILQEVREHARRNSRQFEMEDYLKSPEGSAQAQHARAVMNGDASMEEFGS